MNLADIPAKAAEVADLRAHPSREQLERLALQFAWRERDLRELGRHIDMQVNSLAELRGILLRILWPRPPRGLT